MYNDLSFSIKWLSINSLSPHPTSPYKNKSTLVSFWTTSVNEEAKTLSSTFTSSSSNKEGKQSWGNKLSNLCEDK